MSNKHGECQLHTITPPQLPLKYHGQENIVIVTAGDST